MLVTPLSRPWQTLVHATLCTEIGPVRPLDTFYSTYVHACLLWLQKILESCWFSFLLAYYQVIEARSNGIVYCNNRLL